MAEPKIPIDKPFEVDSVIELANLLFVEHNVAMETIVLECCGNGNFCNGARGVCKHFYDTPPAGFFSFSKEK
jgi:hypothetical protein